MHCVEKQRLKRLAVKRVIREVEVKPCSRCGNKNYLWDFNLMIKTCKQCHDASGVI